eukprot:TRINITY_DN2330_c0_g1_i3.p1 TRINITY_DN2330_c0_g1~~TRINITY_DN2330_c0_g1_i3.p1  ORF type:complete len:212 (+),score=-16.63 TRINITY_DN2330_c0_g1_i3:159-794(+)
MQKFIFFNATIFYQKFIFLNATIYYQTTKILRKNKDNVTTPFQSKLNCNFLRHQYKKNFKSCQWKKKDTIHLKNIQPKQQKKQKFTIIIAISKQRTVVEKQNLTIIISITKQREIEKIQYNLLFQQHNKKIISNQQKCDSIYRIYNVNTKNVISKHKNNIISCFQRLEFKTIISISRYHRNGKAQKNPFYSRTKKSFLINKKYSSTYKIQK